MRNSSKLILASTSPFRRKLLEDAGLCFGVMGAQGDEKTVTDLHPRILARKRAEFKGVDVAKRCDTDVIVIGADQVLSLDGCSFDKAANEAEAKHRLTQLAGRTHYLHSAFCLVAVRPDGRVETVYEDVVDVPMVMRALSRDEIASYVATGEWQGCVGCYRVEGQGVSLFDQLGGDHTAIIGMPLPQLLEALRTVV